MIKHLFSYEPDHYYWLLISQREDVRGIRLGVKEIEIEFGERTIVHLDISKTTDLFLVDELPDLGDHMLVLGGLKLKYSSEFDMLWIQRDDYLVDVRE